MTLPLLVVSAGCGLFGPGDPREALADAVAPLRKGNYTFDATQGGTPLHGVVHLPSRSVLVETKAPESRSRTLVVGDMRYRAFEGGTGVMLDTAPDGTRKPAVPKLPTTWRSEDLTRYKPGVRHGLSLANPDVTGAGEVLGHVVDARRQDDKIVGTLDASRELASHAEVFAPFSKIEPWNGPIPFEATLDNDDRLRRLILTMPQMGTKPAEAFTLEIKSWDESTAQQAPPADEVTPAFDEEYARLNGW